MESTSHSNLELHLSPGRHLWPQTDRRVAELLDQMEDPDVVYIEARDIDEVPLDIKWRARLQAPLLLAIIAFWRSILVELGGAVLGRDKDIAVAVAEEFSIPVLCADEPTHLTVGQKDQAWLSANWLPVFAGAFGSAYGWLNSEQTGFFLTFWLSIMVVASAVSILMVYVALSDDRREKLLLDRIVEDASERGVSEACLIHGSKHTDGLVKKAEESSTVTVVPPEKE